MDFKFDITFQTLGSKARLGRLSTPHGVVETPAFIFCATRAAIKGATPQHMRQENTQIILANTYHLMLQPGSDLVAQMGGLHRFMGWDGPMLTDSGGFQIFSLGHGSIAEEVKGRRQTLRPKSLLKINEEGATFKSYIDGKKHVLTPEKSIQIQRGLGADFIVVLDECTPFHVDKSYTERSMHMSHRWAERSLKEFQKEPTDLQALYGITQGGVYPDLRKISGDFINSLPFFGHAVGGSLGADKAQMAEVVEMAMEPLDPVRPVHLLGIGGISDIFYGVQQGIDTFDCVHPTRLARHGGALVPLSVWESMGEDPRGREHMNLRNARFRDDARPLDETCACQTCQTLSRGYLHHLLKAGELLVMQALTVHNVHFMNRLLFRIRKAISQDCLQEEKKKWIA
ncbi:MAG: tRNA guanosine(34) transglycosylase Tgt [Alphaproteobacteria bacterium 41-28]|nr:MAG: tRNA guanosine(34) transglycosylase Tgt [Alphaproteobacteria bacterium 41-28]